MKMLFCLADYHGCGFYRMMQPAFMLSKIHDVQCRMPKMDEDFSGYDLIVLQRQIHPDWIQIINEGKDRGCKFVYDLDDDIYSMPEYYPGKEYWDKYKYNAEVLMSLCNAVTVSTEPLRKIVRKINSNVYVTRNTIIEPKEPLPEKNCRIRIGCCMTNHHKSDFGDFIVGPLLQASKQAELTFIGYIPPEFIGKAVYYDFIQPQDFIAFLRDMNLDIAVIPCRTEKFNQSRSNLKFLQHGINKTAVIASGTYPYLKTVNSDIGVVVHNKSSEWSKALTELIEDKDKRETMGENAYQFVRSNYLLQNQLGELSNVYTQIARC